VFRDGDNLSMLRGRLLSHRIMSCKVLTICDNDANGSLGNGRRPGSEDDHIRCHVCQT
jgi:hypothetical protein